MAGEKQLPSWVVPAVVGAAILLFIAIAFTFGLSGRPKGDASGTRTAQHFQPVSVLHVLAARPARDGAGVR